MTTPRIYGWCPGALRPMMSGDGLVVRVRAPLGRLTPEQASGLAVLARAHGNGGIDLSARANLQIRGVRAETHTPLMEGLAQLGLMNRDIAAESRTNIVITPFWHRDDATHHVARALTDALAASDALDLPGKFGFAVDCGPAPMLTGTSADIRIERGPRGLICRADGAKAGLSVTADGAAHTALMLARWFLDMGGAPEGRGRMAAHVARFGAPDGCDQMPLPPHPKPGPNLSESGALVALEFGQMQADTLAGLADLGPLRLTPWRMVLIEGATEVPNQPDLITDPTDPRLNVSACTGAPGCLQARSTTRDIARALAPYVDTHLHITGCAKGCAHPDASAVTLTARAQGRFDLIHDGRATDTPTRHDQSLADLLSGVL